jgi:predicted RND superfamily exporter protein
MLHTGVFFYSSLLIGLLAILNPMMGFIAGVGFTYYFGWHMTSLLVVIPFLVLATGVGDAFLVIHEWYIHKDEENTKALQSSSDVDKFEHRFARMIVDMWPSLTITSLTNAWGFGIGITSEIECGQSG